MSHEFVFKKLTCASCGFPLFCAQVQDPGVERTCTRTSRCDRGSLQPHSHHIQLEEKKELCNNFIMNSRNLRQSSNIASLANCSFAHDFQKITFAF